MKAVELEKKHMTTYSSGILKPYVTRKSVVLPSMVMNTETVDCPLVDCSLMLRMI